MADHWYEDGSKLKKEGEVTINISWQSQAFTDPFMLCHLRHLSFDF